MTVGAAREAAVDWVMGDARTGRHREAVFWMVATFARCHKILSADAPVATRRALAPGHLRVRLHPLSRGADRSRSRGWRAVARDPGVGFQRALRDASPVEVGPGAVQQSRQLIEAPIRIEPS
jgi:hypothetical protein